LRRTQASHAEQREQREAHQAKRCVAVRRSRHVAIIIECERDVLLSPVSIERFVFLIWFPLQLRLFAERRNILLKKLDITSAVSMPGGTSLGAKTSASSCAGVFALNLLSQGVRGERVCGYPAMPPTDR
jgi:hypothetical protein